MAQFLRTKPMIVATAPSELTVEQQGYALANVLAKLKALGTVKARLDWYGYWVCETCSERITDKNTEIVCGCCGMPFCDSCHQDHMIRMTP
jgi:hypothetical protein